MVITSKENDTPPSYDSLASSPRPTADQKRPIPAWPSASAAAGPSRPPFPTPNPRQEGNGVAWAPWSPEYWKRRQEELEISRTVRALLRDVVHNLSDPASLDVLHSSYLACASHGISFPTLSQEPIESHPALYWALLTLSPLAKSLPGGSLSSSPPEEGWPAIDLLSSFPLSDTTQREAIAACALGDDNALFQYLRQTDGFTPQGLAESITSRLPAGEGRAVDTVRVEHVADGKAGHFRIRFQVRDWLRRIRMHQKVSVRWIARGRAWQMTFGISHGEHYSSGTWYCSISLVRYTGSNNAALTASVTLSPSTSAPSSSDLLTPSGSGPGFETPETETVTLKLQQSSLDANSEQPCYVKLSDTRGAASLEYEDSLYIGPDGPRSSNMSAAIGCSFKRPHAASHVVQAYDEGRAHHRKKLARQTIRLIMCFQDRRNLDPEK
ncbi:hypothetical protein CALVIDRAFT_552427 [Calocera viscosa TUFC12733]|uniref:Uncharacterized protein n=1 Tax=Calocera viscosa (strain TUFC12733) TaxID=1330018 RepID=A0A167R998_CALVF|nr:hypothetical protein CALVIDRAFT_552427 [Calocera viscosa TUFC12733]